MRSHRAVFLAIAIAAIGAPVLAQSPGPGSPGPRMGPATMDDMRGMMRTLMNDPVISKRMKELMASNPTFKTHFERMRDTMSSGGMMPYGGSGMHGSMMYGSPGPKP